MKPLRVMIAHCRYQQRGGEDMVVDDEAILLQSRGHAVSMFIRDNHDIKTMSPWQVATQTLWSTRTTRDLQRAINSFKPDIIHAHNSFPLLSPSLYWAATRHGIPVVQTLHNFRLLCPQAMLLRDGAICEDCLGRMPWRGVMHGCYGDSVARSAVLTSMLMMHRALGTYQHKVTRYIALNEFCRQKFIAGGLPAEKLVVKPNFVDLPSSEAQQRQGGLFVGRLSPEKGLSVLLTALDDVPTCQVDVLGEGIEFVKAQHHPQVHARGWQAPAMIHEYMRRAAYLVMPSIWYENFPRTLVEAMACGLPVIASRCGALADLIEDGVSGMLFEPGSTIDLACCLRWAERHPQEMLEMGRNARLVYERQYTPEQNYRQLLGIYTEAMTASQRQGAA